MIIIFVGTTDMYPLHIIISPCLDALSLRPGSVDQHKPLPQSRWRMLPLHIRIDSADQVKTQVDKHRKTALGRNLAASWMIMPHISFCILKIPLFNSNLIEMHLPNLHFFSCIALQIWWNRSKKPWITLRLSHLWALGLYRTFSQGLTCSFPWVAKSNNDLGKAMLPIFQSKTFPLALCFYDYVWL